MNIYFYQYHKLEDEDKYIWLDSHVYTDTPNIFDGFTKSFRDSIDYLTIDELKIINDIYYELRDNHEIKIKFHTQYSLETGILDQKRSIERKKDKTNTFDNRLSFSLISKTHAILITLHSKKEDFIYIPDDLSFETNKKLPLKVIDLSTFYKLQDEKIFPNKKLLFKDLFELVEEVQSLNDKLDYFLKNKNPIFVQSLQT